MNFLKVKNYIVLFLISFFISIGFVSAKTLEGSVYFENNLRDSAYSSSINLFEETKEYTPFVQLLYNQGFVLGQYLNDYFSIGNSEFFSDKYNYSISIFKENDLKYISQTCYTGGSGSCTSYSSDYSKYLDNTLFGTNSYFKDGYSSDDVVYYIYFNLHDSSAESWGYEDYLYLRIYPRYIFFFNSEGIPIGYKTSSTSTDYWGGSDENLNYKTYHIFKFPYDSNDNIDITSWYFYLYYDIDTNYFTSSYFDKIYPKYFYFNGEKHSTSDNAGYNALENFWQNVKNGFNSFQIDFSQWNMQFIYDDVFYKENINFVPLMKRWYSTTSYVVPSSYQYISVSDSEKGYYLVPKSGCSKNDYVMYFSSDSYDDRHKLYLTYYKLEDSILNFYKSFYTYSSKSYSIYSYNPLLDLGVSVDDYLNYSINLTQSSLIIDYKLYYNPSCYYSYLANNSDVVLSFNSGSVTLSSNDLNDNYLNNNKSNYYVNSNVNSESSSGSSNPNVNNSDSNNMSNVGDIMSNLGDYASGIVGSVQALVGVTTVFLTGLPPMIYNFLFSVFAVGMIIFIIKLIK